MHTVCYSITCLYIYIHIINIYIYVNTFLQVSPFKNTYNYIYIYQICIYIYAKRHLCDLLYYVNIYKIDR